MSAHATILFFSETMLAISFFYCVRIGLHTLADGRSTPASFQKRFMRWIDRQHVSRLWRSCGRGNRLEKLATTAGLPPSWTAERFLILKAWSVRVAFVLVVLAYMENNVPSIPLIELLFGILLISYSWPDLFLARRTAIRKKLTSKTIGYFIDLLSLQVGAGANLETAFRTLAPNLPDLWKREVTRIVFELDRGIPLGDALTMMSKRLDTPDVDRFVLSIIQAERIGASLGDSLAMQADMARTRRRQKAEALARTASVKIALPLVFCIFPALLIIYIAPAILRLMQLSL